jgi:peptidoglycan hydrolase-like protein with peptidoglycan-binding domain
MEYQILRPPPRRHSGLMLAVGLVLVVVAIASGAFVLGRIDRRSSPTIRPSTGAATLPLPTRSLAVLSTVPANGAAGVPSDQVVTVTLSAPVADGSGLPVFDPQVPGTWRHSGTRVLTFHAEAPFVPTTTETLTLPAGSAGPRSTTGDVLVAPVTVTFGVAQASTERLQQLLAQLNYLPVSFTPAAGPPASAEAATAQGGVFAWRWTGVPPDFASVWTEGAENPITKGALMSFQRQHGLTVDGIAGHRVWTALLSDATASKSTAEPYVNVMVSKQVPQTLTLYTNGSPLLAGQAVNTGARGADTAAGTFPVFEHIPSSRMRGTNPDGSTYDDPAVPWASYFNGGDALHGFVRASYGTPQSNGCVEMPIPLAAQVWSLTPVGTLVTVVGPPS